MQDHPRVSPRYLAALALGFVLSTGAAVAQEEKLPAGTRVVRLEAIPPAVTLKNPFDYAQVILTGQLATGDKVDVSRMVKIETPDLVKVSPTGLVRPVADGAGQIRFSLSGQSVGVPVKVAGQKDKYPVSFARDVMPAMSK